MTCPESLLRGGTADVPATVRLCPECGGELYVQSTEWDSETGVPTQCGLEVSCKQDDENLMEWELMEGVPFKEMSHRWWQSDWQDVIDDIAAWCGAK